MPTIERINQLAETDLIEALLRCCGCRAWAQKMAQARPYVDAPALLESAEHAWQAASLEDRLEAFSHHPMIGERQLREKFGSTASWAEQEQKGASNASEQTLSALARANELYMQKFGYVFLICATGKSADEMLGALQKRIHNSPAQEIDIAAGEQAKITRLRLEKWLNDA